jgi:hypothetical protein
MKVRSARIVDCEYAGSDVYPGAYIVRRAGSWAYLESTLEAMRTQGGGLEVGRMLESTLEAMRTQGWKLGVFREHAGSDAYPGLEVGRI